METELRRERGFFPWSNSFLIAVNVLVFCAGPIAGVIGMNEDFPYRFGVLYAPLLLKGRDFHRLLTAVFLHADAAHLFNNMVVQFAGGNIVEKNLGHARYLALYLVCGIAGNAASVLSDYLTGEYGFSVGASGAVFGIVGALVYLIVRESLSLFRQNRQSGREGRRGAQDAGIFYSDARGASHSGPSGDCEGAFTAGARGIALSGSARDCDAGAARGPYAGARGAVPAGAFRSLLIRACVMTGWLLYSGWSNPMVNQAAHVGGMLSGFVLAPVLMAGRPRADLEALL